MTIKKTTTRELIANEALRLINNKGLEYAGLREIASNLGIRVSNLTYYFPTKDDLVNYFTLELKKLNEQVFVQEMDLSINAFLDKMHHAFLNQIKYRGLMISVVHIMANNKVINKRHKATQERRNEILVHYLQLLCKNGYLKIVNNKVIEKLAAAIGIIARFWISEAAISYKKSSLHDQADFNLSLIARMLEPYATTKAKHELKKY